MIKSKMEYRATKTAIQKLQNTLGKIDEAIRDLEPWAKDAYQASIEGQVMELQDQLQEYKVAGTLRTGRRKARIAKKSTTNS